MAVDLAVAWPPDLCHSHTIFFLPCESSKRSIDKSAVAPPATSYKLRQTQWRCFFGWFGHFNTASRHVRLNYYYQ
jgi:hypothetical protein